MKREVPKTAVVEILVVLSVVLVSSSEVVSSSEILSLSVVVEVVEESLSLLVLQEMIVRLKRNRERKMSRCLTRFPNCLVLGEFNLLILISLLDVCYLFVV